VDSVPTRLRVRPLTTERLELRPVRRRDARELERLFHDPRVNRYLPRGPRRESGTALVARALEGVRLGTAVRFSIRRRPDGDFVGQMTLFRIDPEDRRAELGYAIRRRHWGQGYAREAAARVVRWGFEELRLHRVDAMVVDGNGASVRVLEHLGFRPEGVRREAARTAGRYLDLLEFGMLAPRRSARRIRRAQRR
jgi:[ribosomal protein S5]-alanine N-acetyltransferase